MKSDWLNKEWISNSNYNELSDSLKSGKLKLEMIRFGRFQNSYDLLEEIEEKVGLNGDDLTLFFLNTIKARLQGYLNLNEDRDRTMELLKSHSVESTLGKLELDLLDVHFYDPSNIERIEKLKIELEQCEDENLHFKLHSIFLLTLLSSNLKLSDPKQALTYLNEALKYDQELDHKLLYVYHLREISLVKGQLSQYGKAEELMKKSLKLYQDLEIESEIMMTKKNLADIYFYQGEFNSALELLEETVSMAKQLGNDFVVGATYLSMGSIQSEQGSHDEGIKSYKTAYDIFEKMEIKRGMAVCMINTGGVLNDSGRIRESIEASITALDLIREINDPHNEGVVLENIAQSYFRMGQFEQSLDYTFLAMESYQKIDDPFGKVYAMSYLGNIYLELGKYEEARKQFNESYNLRKKMNSPKEEAIGVTNLIQLEIALDNVELAKKKLNELAGILENTDDELSKLDYQLVRALILKRGYRLRDKAEAEHLLRKIADQGVVSANISIKALQNLVEILFDELKLYGHPEVLSEIGSYIEKLKKLSETDQLWPIIARTYILEAQLALLNDKPIKSLELFDKAEHISREFELNNTIALIKQFKGYLEADYELWNSLSNLKLPLSKKIKLSLVSSFIENTKKTVSTPLSKIEIDHVSEEEIFVALAHPDRREILHILHNSRKVTFSSLKEVLGLASGSIVNHLKNTGGLVVKNADQSYSLSKEGRSLTQWIFGGRPGGIEVEYTE